MKTFKLLVFSICISVATFSSANYSEKPQVGDFVDLMVNKHQFERQQILEWLAAAEHQTSIVKAMTRPAEKVKPWYEYRKLFVSDLRIKRGVEFWQQHEKTLERAYQQYGVDPAIIVSILGVETNYGRNTGSYRVVDALSTLAFDFYHSIEKRESRKKFFTIQLENLFLLAREQSKDPLTLKGSYAGAMGWGQFMPDSYRDYAVDFDGDNLVDIWENPTDAIGSVANFLFKKGKWEKDQPVATRAHIKENLDLDGLNKMRAPKKTIAELEKQGFIPAKNYDKDSLAFPMMLTGKYGDEYWLGLHNFYSIGRYNPRIKYAMAVYQLSLMIREQRCEAIEDCD
ncbi:MAG: lytic murein transglycosylase B [Porticoccaceae bacterium]